MSISSSLLARSRLGTRHFHVDLSLRIGVFKVLIFRDIEFPCSNANKIFSFLAKLSPQTQDKAVRDNRLLMGWRYGCSGDRRGAGFAQRFAGGAGRIRVVYLGPIIGQALGSAFSTAGTTVAAAGTGAATGTAAVGMTAAQVGAAAAAGTLSGGALVGYAAGYAVAGAIGSLASQGLAMALGMQKGINWGQVGLSAVASGMGGGFAASGAFGTGALAMVERGMAISAATQGVAMATGMQKSFSWTSVAASGAAAWAGGRIGSLGGADSASQVGYGTLAGIAGGTIQSVLGEDHRPNWGDLAASSFGNAVGSALMADGSAQRQKLQQDGFTSSEEPSLASVLNDGVVGDASSYGANSAKPSVYARNMSRGGLLTPVDGARQDTGVQPNELLLNGTIVGPGQGEMVIVTGTRPWWGRQFWNWTKSAAESLGNLLQGAGERAGELAHGIQSFATDQIYATGYALTLGRMDDRGALARNRAFIENLPNVPGQLASQFNDVMYYGAHPGEQSAYGWGRAVVDVASIIVPELRLGRAGALSASVGGRMLVADSLEATSPTVGRMAWKYLPMTRPASIMPDVLLAPGVERVVGDVPNSTVNQGIFGARGPYSGRPFEPSEAGGPLRDLTTDNIKVTARGIEIVEKHTSRFGPDEGNGFMIDRLRKIAGGRVEATQYDLNYYSHELREYTRYRRLGWEVGQPSDPMAARDLWNNTHSATLEEYRLRDGQLYHPEAPQ
ncbi:hypothetical protein ABH313_19595 [Chromobacterium vaccinii]|uniref:hypothetical protein n=2 Tax=Chromobacterium vaccinii TaxID=1108595 RepID=UPI003260D1AF